MFSPWRSEYYWLTWLFLVGLFAAQLTQQYLFILFICSLFYLARHLFHINRMLVWLRVGGRIPSSSGIWEEIYYLIYRLRRRNKSRKKKLLAILERFRTATAALPDATVVLGPRDEIDWYNDAAERLLGLRKCDLNQQIVNLVRYPKFAEFLRQSDCKGTVNIPSPVIEKMQLEIRVVPYGEDLRLLLAQDVTHLRFMEQVRTDFVANVSHELRSPLTVLKGYTETLSDAKLPEHYLKIFKSMEMQTLRMQNLVDGLLSLTRLEAGVLSQAKPVDVPSLLVTICEEVKILEAEHPDIQCDLQTDAWLSGVESELRSAFSNLILNAVKYTQPEGRVTVSWLEEEDSVRLVVQDNGPGIDSEHLPRLTERFYRVEQGKGGTGLGLAIVKHVLSRHEAELKITSKPGEGSCFKCIFPAKRITRKP